MKLVTFGRAEMPYNAGDKRLVPDDVAENLRRSGVLSAVETWPKPAAPPPPPAPATPQKPARPVIKPVRPVIRPTRGSDQLDLNTPEE